MKVIVPVKRVVDYNVKVRVKPDNTGVDLSNVKMSVNPFCEIGIEEAVRLKEAGVAEKVIAVSVGSTACQEQLRTCLALGADRAVLVETDVDAQPLGIARALVAVQERVTGMVIFGKQSIGGDNSQTGQMFAALTGMPQATFASEVTVADGKAQVLREIDGGMQTLSVTLPAVVTQPAFERAALRVSTKHYEGEEKPLDVLTPEELGVDLSPTVGVESRGASGAGGGIKVESVEQLVDKLKNEAKVIS